jgi:hypothetical protein
MDYHKILGIISAGLQFYCFVPYLMATFRHTVKPHVFTWLIWGLISAITCIIQLSEGAGAGTWLLAVNATASFLIAGMSVKHGKTNITKGDWVCLFAALVTIPLWLLMKQALGSIMILWLINNIAFWPTIRKSWSRPFDESAQLFFLGGVASLLATIAVERVAFITLFFPAWLVISNLGFVALILLRRRVVQH